LLGREKRKVAKGATDSYGTLRFRVFGEKEGESTEYTEITEQAERNRIVPAPFFLSSACSVISVYSYSL
jgi:hypothetical protein